MWWAFLQCWAGLPPVVLGPSVLSKGIEIGPIATHFGQLVHKLCLVCQKLRAHAHGRIFPRRLFTLRKTISLLGLGPMT